jgi:ribonuclease-3
LNETRDHLLRALGHRFGDAALLQRALTHRSAGPDNNERLEFLGDALLNLAIADALYRLRPAAPEGDLSRLRASLVREPTLAAAARRISLGESIHLGAGELRSGGFRRDSILADGLEALIGAVYLDAGFEAATALCRRLLEPELAALPDAGSLKDAKTRLQEWLQAIPRPLPEYSVLREEGPPHRRIFTVRCRLIDDESALEADGNSRRAAEQTAAERMLRRLQNPETGNG